MLNMRRKICVAFVAILVAAGCGRTSTDSAEDINPATSTGVAVFSFIPLSTDSEAAALEITRNLIQSLGRSPKLRVLTESDLPPEMRDVSTHDRWPESDLVSLVVEGNLRKIDSNFRVTVQIIEASSDAHVWSEYYDSEQLELTTIVADIDKQVLRAASH